MKYSFLSSCALLLVLTSCTTTKYILNGNYRLSTVENNGTDSITQVKTATYADDMIGATLSVGENSIKVKLSNKTNSSMKILWDEASFVDPSGNAHRVIHGDVKIMDIGKAQIPSVVPKGKQYVGELVLEDSVEWVHVASRDDHGYWKHNTLIKGVTFDKESEAMSSTIKFNPVLLLLPVEIDGQRYEYSFNFVSKSKSISKSKEFDLAKTAWMTLGVTAGASLFILFAIASAQ